MAAMRWQGWKIAAAQELSGNRSVRTEVRFAYQRQRLKCQGRGRFSREFNQGASRACLDWLADPLLGRLLLPKLRNSINACTSCPSLQRRQLPALGPYIFRSCVTNGYQGKALAKFALDNLQKQRAAIPCWRKVLRTWRQLRRSFGVTFKVTVAQ